MSKRNLICFIIFIIIVIIACCIILYYRRITKNTLKQLSEMIELVINGEFTEATYDESKLSAIENRLNQYLKQSIANERQLSDEKNRVKSLISDISHQTKTPISNIMLYSQLLSEEDLSEEAVTYTNQIITQVDKLNFLITALIKTSRLEQGIITVDPKKNPVDELLQSVYQEIKPMAEKKNMGLHIVKSDITAYFDMKWSIEAIYNIVDNAVKYTRSGEKITIEPIEYDLFVCINIEDTGIGIEEGDINKIFKRFYRSSAVNQYEGVGIGLFLTQTIISAQRGYLKVSSKLGEGSKFSVFLPKHK